MLIDAHNAQPEIPIDVELCLLSARGRVLAELRGLQTTTDRNTIAAPLDELWQTAENVLFREDDGGADEINETALMTQASFLYQAFKETVPEWQEHAKKKFRPYDEILQLKCSDLGKTLLHGLMVERWRDRNNVDVSELTADNWITCSFALDVSKSHGGQEVAQNLGEIFTSMPGHFDQQDWLFF